MSYVSAGAEKVVIATGKLCAIRKAKVDFGVVVVAKPFFLTIVLRFYCYAEQ